MGTAGIVALNASGGVKGSPGMVCAVVLTAGGDAASVTLYDNTAGSGAKLVVLKAGAGSSAVFCPAAPVAAGRGIYAVLTGTGAEAFVQVV